MIQGIWEQIKARLKPCEIEEAEFLLGSWRIERNADVANEIQNLIGLFDEVPPRFKELAMQKSRLELYMSKISERAKELGLMPEELVGLRTPRDRNLFQMLLDGERTRPPTAESVPSSDHLPSTLDLFFIESHQEGLCAALDHEFEELKARASEVQQDLLGQALMPTQKEVADFAKRLEVTLS
jgi:hypothetical protein